MLSIFSWVCWSSVCLWRNVCLDFLIELFVFSGIELYELLVYFGN